MADGPTTKMTRIQEIQRFLEEHGEVWDLANYQIENADIRDGKMTLTRVTPGCVCETKKKGGGVKIDPKQGKKTSAGNVVDEGFELTETITIGMVRTKKGADEIDEFVMTYETPICKYKQTKFEGISKITYVPEAGKTYPVKKTEIIIAPVGTPEDKACPASKTISKPASIDQISYGVILAAYGELGLPDALTVTHKPLIDFLRQQLNKAEK